MRWTSLCAAAVLLAALGAASPGSAESAPPADELEVLVTGALPGAEEDVTGAALRELVALVLQTSGVRSRAVPPPPTCEEAAEPECRSAVLRALAGGRLHAALVAVSATEAPSGWALRDAGLDVLGDAAPPWRRACLAAPAAPAALAALAPGDAAPRSLLDLADATLAARYDVRPEELARALGNVPPANGTLDSLAYPTGTTSPEWCETEPCAALLTASRHEAALLGDLARSLRLRARAVPLGAALPGALGRLARPTLACHAAPGAIQPVAAVALGPPPCAEPAPCPFEPLRLLKVANARALARSPSALRALARFALSAAQLRELGERAAHGDPAAAATAFLAAHGSLGAAGAAGEARVAVLVAGGTPREVGSARALAAAAALAEEDEATAAAAAGRRGARFKVEVSDDGCSASRAYKYLLDALGTGEYGALSAVAGPACGAAFADVARQSPAHALPVLAYSPQAAPADARYVLLAGGAARQAAGAVGALLARLGWRRLAALSEPGSRALLDAARLRADVVVHAELSEEPEIDYTTIRQWVTRVVAANARILYVALQDARAVRCALCAGSRAGLLPAAGAVWLLPPLPAAALRRAAADPHDCSDAELAEALDGHLSVAPAWQARWSAAAAPPDWTRRWRQHCRRLPAGPDAAPGRADAECLAAPAQAALLYDALRLWAAALGRLLARRPAALDDLHEPHLVRELMDDVVSGNYTGLTGRFEWRSGARSGPWLLLQWERGAARGVAEYDAGEGEGELRGEGPRWRTRGVPSDGAEPCALQPLADALRADCRVALAALLVLLLAALAAVLGAAGCLVKRRLERRYRAKLAALGLLELAPKSDALDRWELPRERVVINRKLGMGAFGTVYGGHALLGGSGPADAGAGARAGGGGAEGGTWTAVAVKTLRAGAGTADKLDFLAEAEAMKRFDHKNVVRLLGVVTHSEPVCTVMEFMLYGDLKGYLLARRHLAAAGAGGAGGEGDADEVSPRRLTGMALDAARALSYLAQLRYVHRDVAARNCLVSARRTVKLADFGMARAVQESDYYRFSRKGLLPVRWMAPESLALGVFSPASDVWAFGVLLYEIVTFGALPYQGLGNAQVLRRVKRGRALDPPPGVKPQLEGLMKACWQQAAGARPSAAEVAAFLADAPRLLTPCLDLPLDALPLGDGDGEPDLDADRAEARWVSWAAPPSAATDTTYLSDAPDSPESPDAPEMQRFLP